MVLKVQAKLPCSDFVCHFQCEFSLNQSTVVIGKSGAGKTSLLRLIAGLERGKEASISYQDHIWQDDKKNTWVPAHRRHIGFVFQELGLFEHLHVMDNLMYGIKRTDHDKFQAKKELNKIADFFEITHLLKRGIGNLSGGEKQRVAIARTLLSNPRLLLLDEPFTGLDVNNKKRILHYLKQIKNLYNIPLILVSHHLDEVITLADHILYLEKGQVIAAGNPNDLLSRLDLPSFDQVTSIISAVITSHDENYQLSQLTFGFSKKQLMVPKVSGSIGEAVNVRIQARDVSVSLVQPKGSSIINCIAAKIIAIQDEDQSDLILKLDVGGVFILAQITRYSACQLELKANMEIYVQIKSVALI